MDGNERLKESIPMQNSYQLEKKGDFLSTDRKMLKHLVPLKTTILSKKKKKRYKAYKRTRKHDCMDN